MRILPFRLFAALLAAALLSSCGGGDIVINGANVRFVNATLTHASLSLSIDSKSTVGATAVNTASGYASVDSGDSSLQVVDATSGVALTTGSFGATKKNHYTVVAYESGGVVQTTTIDEDASAPSSGTVTLNVLDAAIEAGGVDIYIAPATSDITSISAPALTFATATTIPSPLAYNVAPGTYQLRVTGASNPTDVRLDIASFTVTSQQLATIVLTPTTGGTLVNGAVLVQQGAFTDGHNTQARLRLVAAVSGNAAVSQSAAATPIFTGVPSPNVTSYALVPGGAALGVTVNGATVSGAATGPAAGSDATLIVHGDPGAATAMLIADDNRLPSSTSVLRLRLVNGLTGTAQPLSLSSNFVVVASNVAPGAASAYGVVTASTTTQLTVTAASTPIYSPPVFVTTGGAVYTLFMLGDFASPIGQLRQDR